MATESTSTVREMPQELFDSFSMQFDALTQAIQDAGFPVLHTCQILLGETDDALALSNMSAVCNLQGETAVRMAAAAAAKLIIDGITSVLKDESGNIPAEKLIQLIPLTKEVTDMFSQFFTRAMAMHAGQVLKESGCSDEEQAEALMFALMKMTKDAGK